MTEELPTDGLFRILPDECLPPVPDDFTSPCLIEVRPKHRPGRGRWWRPRSNGYTNIPGEAGVYSAEEAEKICANQDRVYRVDAARVARLAQRSAEKLLNAIGEVSHAV